MPTSPMFSGDCSLDDLLPTEPNLVRPEMPAQRSGVREAGLTAMVVINKVIQSRGYLPTVPYRLQYHKDERGKVVDGVWKMSVVHKDNTNCVLWLWVTRTPAGWKTFREKPEELIASGKGVPFNWCEHTHLIVSPKAGSYQ